MYTYNKIKIWFNFNIIKILAFFHLYVVVYS